MRRLKVLTIALGSTGLILGWVMGVAGQGAGQRVTPGEIAWPSGASSTVGTSAVAGIETTILKGDPRVAGLYTMLLRVGVTY